MQRRRPRSESASRPADACGPAARAPASRAAARTAGSPARRPRCSSRARGWRSPGSAPRSGSRRLACPASAGEMARKPSGNASSASVTRPERPRHGKPRGADRGGSQHGPAAARRARRASTAPKPSQTSMRMPHTVPNRVPSTSLMMSAVERRPERHAGRGRALQHDARARRSRRRSRSRSRAAPCRRLREPLRGARQRRSAPATERQRRGSRSRAGRRSRRPPRRSRRTGAPRTTANANSVTSADAALLREQLRDRGSGRAGPCRIENTRPPETGWLSAEITR